MSEKLLFTDSRLLMKHMSSCLSNRKFERLGGPVDEIVTVFCTQIQCHNATSYYDIMTSFDSRDRLPRHWLLHSTN